MHREIAGQLERVARGEIDRLMLLVPPQHGKSELASRRFPAWFLGHNPDKNIISASASATLADDYGRECRGIIQSQEYQDIFPDTRLAEDAMAKGRWRTQVGGSYTAVGVGGALYGVGCHIAVLDDLVGSIAAARSETTRKEVFDWYTGTLYNRLQKGGAIVLINHRTHTADLSGMLLEQQAAGGDKWEVVQMKALSDEGEALWPDEFSVEELHRRRAVDAKVWASLYQQSPVIEEGGMFRPEWIREVVYPFDRPPPFLRCYGASDLALSVNKGDFSVHCVIGIDHEGRMHLVGLWRQQAAPKDTVEAMLDLILKFRPAFWAHEKIHIVQSIGPYLETRQRARGAWCQQELFPVRGDKATRSASIRGKMELNGLFVPAGAPWLADFKNELLGFPDAAHDDIVDAVSLCGLLMDRWSPGVRPTKKIAEFEDKQYVAKDLNEMRLRSFMTM
jgi:predicted phage terminase large subunit-like protein